MKRPSLWDSASNYSSHSPKESEIAVLLPLRISRHQHILRVGADLHPGALRGAWVWKLIDRHLGDEPERLRPRSQSRPWR